MNCGISITWMHACDREILRLDLEKLPEAEIHITHQPNLQFV